MKFNFTVAGENRFRAAGISLLIFLCAFSVASAANTESDNNWVATWSASPQPLWEGDFALPTNAPGNLEDRTLRQVARVSAGGERVRVVLSNRYGSKPLRIGAAHLALSGGEAEIVADSGRALTFSGEKAAVIPPGASMVSDPVALSVKPLQQLAVSLYLPQPTPPQTFHWDGLQTAYIGDGNQVDSGEMEIASTTNTRVFLSGILVDAEKKTRAVVAFGDSITDGNASTPDANHRWPDFLAERLAGRNIAVVNAGISGARLLDSFMGENALARFQRDVLGQPGVSTAVVLMGINDIGWPGSDLAPKKSLPEVGQMIGIYRQLIARAHLHDVRILGATLTPFENALDGAPVQNYYTEEKEALRQEINRWIRESGEFDAVIDFDRALRDPDNPRHIRAEYDSGDHLHPGDAGYRAMAEAVDPELL
ncbi:SGNH/GDSL hydrolase family protein [Microbulbifer halophilus]|uniref:SGNH/GDSL hydrolase family protein n=1 Tax=Microbulbifer halophilus TaxID=453963 RepID=A0ABW5E7G6_9GAMM|nr:SGNH/GDSL hydrolase family protein [Microbulbifer halophilus]MCW8125833.1 SGNH/GDSL hydrolase family protein [Microbulbifer halophilus]